ncbi:hypothetical protein [Peribacillus kribbensis]|uniref:hypothetical protein n=1 Tax=Peribacillus kribbensis TaxID=356658 RepID=UPI00042A33D3|nr:hypothetical protein [Peribacillus kribbensis]
MESIILIKGRVKFPITLDPGVWIFDDRKLDLDEFFASGGKQAKNELEEYTKSASKHWDREITEGAIFPPTLKTEKKYEKEKVLTGTFGIELRPFLTNAIPLEEAGHFIIETKDESLRFSLEDAFGFILGFSKDGKPLKEDGPIYVYFKDGSNYTDPIKNVQGFYVE